MPQFQLEHFLPQLAWLALFFAILYFGIVSFTLPKIGRVMERREQAIGTDLTTAESAKAEADQIRADYEASVVEVHTGAQASIADARGRVARSVEAKLADAQSGVDRRLAEADAELAAARDRAFGEIDGVAGQIAAELVERLTGTSPSEKQIRAALQSVGAEG